MRWTSSSRAAQGGVGGLALFISRAYELAVGSGAGRFTPPVSSHCGNSQTPTRSPRCGFRQAAAENHEQKRFDAGLLAILGQSAQEQQERVLHQVLGIEAPGCSAAGEGDEAALISLDQL